MTQATSMLRIRTGKAAVSAGLFVVAGVFILNPQPTPHSRTPLVFSTGAVATATANTGDVNWDISNINHDHVDKWIERFTTSPTLKPRFAVWLDRKPSFERMISTKLAQRDMPQDLIYLAMIESGFNPKAYSHAHAGGLWQFIAETGRRYGLTIRKGLDERNNPEKATDAALAYLSDLHDRFGSWYLAAAAYNTGENRVGRIMRKVTGSERGSDADFYRISHLLPRETRDYVPMMVAAARIAKDPGKYGFESDVN